jgi:hypothetical protein
VSYQPENEHEHGHPAMSKSDGIDANASTTLGSLISTQMDNMTISATVRFDGPNAYEGGDDHQIIYYNGHGGVTGWGIIVMNSGGGFADGTVCILAGASLSRRHRSSFRAGSGSTSAPPGPTAT